MDYVITAADRQLFKRCRRAWDFGARARQNLEPDVLSGVDIQDAVREALAVYYFPGMWEWSNRSMVERLAMEGFERTLRRQRAAAGERSDIDDRLWTEAAETGTRLLKRYFRWAPTVDRFSPIRVNTDFYVTLEDPQTPEKDLVSRDGKRLLYTGTIDMLVVDPHDAYWLVNHRLTAGDWSDADLLVLDDVYSSYCWAWERFFLGMTIAGVQYNELRIDVPEEADRTQAPDERPAGGAHIGGVAPVRRMYLQPSVVPSEIQQRQEGAFRRTLIPRSPKELGVLRAQMAAEALELSDPAVRAYPTPSPANCGKCPFRAPCLLVNEGEDPGGILASAFRPRPPVEEGTEPRIGSATWSMNRGAAPPGWEERVRRPAESLPERDPN
jgi:hypothetical protein